MMMFMNMLWLEIRIHVTECAAAWTKRMLFIHWNQWQHHSHPSNLNVATEYVFLYLLCFFLSKSYVKVFTSGVWWCHLLQTFWLHKHKARILLLLQANKVFLFFLVFVFLTVNKFEGFFVLFRDTIKKKNSKRSE